MSHPENETCSNCKYWASKTETSGECRINPPTVLLLNDVGKTASHWPDTQANDWCGQFAEDDSADEEIKPYGEVISRSAAEVLGIEDT